MVGIVDGAGVGGWVGVADGVVVAVGVWVGVADGVGEGWGVGNCSAVGVIDASGVDDGTVALAVVPAHALKRRQPVRTINKTRITIHLAMFCALFSLPQFRVGAHRQFSRQGNGIGYTEKDAVINARRIAGTRLTMRTLTVHYLGQIAYTAAWDIQRQLAAERSRGQIGDTLLVLEHPPTITLGNKARPDHVLASPAELAARGVAVVKSDRGGEVTYHAPGQLVAYPIFKLSQHGSDVGRYVRGLEESVIRVLASYGLAGERLAGLTGVWVRNGAAKICAIGVKLSASGVTTHGLALNVNPDLSGFDLIVPCGITDRSVTSLAFELGQAPSLAEVAERLITQIGEVFALEPRVETLAM